MRFVVIGHDGTDEGAPDRRQAAREAHLDRARSEFSEGRLVSAAAILDDEENMIGSIITVELPDEQAVREWAASDPYVAGGVWKRLEIYPTRFANFEVS